MKNMFLNAKNNLIFLMYFPTEAQYKRDSGLMQTIENDGAFLGRDFFRFFFIFATIFLNGAYPPKNVLLFYLSHFGGCEDDLYISPQQIDGWADTLKTLIT